MTVVVGLLIGNETWTLLERSITSLRAFHPEQDVIIYYSLADGAEEIVEALNTLGVETIDIGRPGLMELFSAATYSNYSTAEFNIKTSFKWLALLAAMTTRLEDVIFIDADIKIISPLPFSEFAEIWQHYDIFVQDEGNSILPKHPCTGFIGFKFCEANVSLLEALHKEQCAAIVSAQSQHDQGTFYNYIARSIDVYKRVYFLPQLLFPVGYLAPIYRDFQAKIAPDARRVPVIYHANWVVGKDAKAALMDGFQDPEKDPIPSSADPIRYRVGAFDITLPADHKLPAQQAQHPLYGQFLPHLAQRLPDSSVVVDVGANCGEALAGMASRKATLHFLCIEANPACFSLLEQNIETIKSLSPGLQADALLAASGGAKPQPLDVALEGVLQLKKPISLLKIAAGGWDCEVLISACQRIEQQRPLIVFDHNSGDAPPLEACIQTLAQLAQLGYAAWFVFDGDGDFVLETTSCETVAAFLAYVKRHVSSQAFAAIQLLAAAPAQGDLVRDAIAAHLA